MKKKTINKCGKPKLESSLTGKFMREPPNKIQENMCARREKNAVDA